MAEKKVKEVKEKSIDKEKIKAIIDHIDGYAVGACRFGFEDIIATGEFLKTLI